MSYWLGRARAKASPLVIDSVTRSLHHLPTYNCYLHVRRGKEEREKDALCIADTETVRLGRPVGVGVITGSQTIMWPTPFIRLHFPIAVVMCGTKEEGSWRAIG